MKFQQTIFDTDHKISHNPNKQAKNIVEGVPKVLKEKLPKADAEKMKAKLEEVGAKVVIE